MKKIVVVLFGSFLLFSCNSSDSFSERCIETLKFHHSAEKQALYIQAYNWARYSLDGILKKRINAKRPAAVILDLDETVLDNTPFLIEEMKAGRSYSKERWEEWVLKEEAPVLPGALEFLRYAKRRGVDIFLVSNRYEASLDETFSNLEKVGIGFVPKERVLLKRDTSDKTARRVEIEKTHDIVMLIGDNLRDFTEDFASREDDGGSGKVESHIPEWGRRFIVLPNSMYGEWMKE